MLNASTLNSSCFHGVLINETHETETFKAVKKGYDYYKLTGKMLNPDSLETIQNELFVLGVIEAFNECVALKKIIDNER